MAEALTCVRLGSQSGALETRMWSLWWHEKKKVVWMVACSKIRTFKLISILINTTDETVSVSVYVDLPHNFQRFSLTEMWADVVFGSSRSCVRRRPESPSLLWGLIKDSMKEVDYVNRNGIESLALEDKVRMKQLGDHQPRDVRNQSAGKKQLFHQEVSSVYGFYC